MCPVVSPFALVASRLQISTTMAAEPLIGAVEGVVAWCIAAVALRSFLW